MGDPAGEDVGAEILPGGGPAELVGQPGEEPAVDGGVVRLRSVALRRRRRWILRSWRAWVSRWMVRRLTPNRSGRAASVIPGWSCQAWAMASRRSAGLAGWLGRARPGALSGTPSRSVSTSRRLRRGNRPRMPGGRLPPPQRLFAGAKGPRPRPHLSVYGARMVVLEWFTASRHTWRSAVAAAGVYRVAKALESPVRFGLRWTGRPACQSQSGVGDRRLPPDLFSIPCGVNSLREQLSGCALAGITH